MQRNIVISLIVSIALVGGTLYVVSDTPASSLGGDVAEAQNVEVRDGVQYVTVHAKGGYSPRVSLIQPGLPTKLLVKTNGTYDCSAALVVRSLNFQKILQPTGEEIVDLGIPKTGEKIQGVCGMGMYSFEIQTS